MTMDPAMAIEVAAMSKHKAMEEAIARGDSEIQKFYCNSTVFITGGSGFMGKQMIEKLFRSCDITKIYVLLRAKKGKTIQERVAAMLQDPVFETVRLQKPEFEAKIVAVEGDVADIRLAISHHDWETLTDEVDVIIHMAATTRFDESLRVATMINIRGTREALILGRACKKLKSYVHVSTAYTQALTTLIDQEVYEEFQPSPIPPETLISMVEHMDENRLIGITANLIEDWPNSYTFTKAVAEDVVRSMSDGLPICIVRPGVVVAAYREPAPGWLDISCAYGASGLILGAGLGILHVAQSMYHNKAALVPCDYVNNAIIAAAREAGHSTGGDSTRIFTVSSTVRNHMLQGKIQHFLKKHLVNLASPKALYYNYAFETSNKLLFTFLTWFLHLIPAYAVDFVCLLLGKERRLVKIYEKVYKMSNALSYFRMYNWLFVDKNLEGLYKSLSKTDKTIFNFDITDIGWEEYVQIWCIGIRKYIIKDGLKGTATANKRQFWLGILHYALTFVYFYCIWKVFSGIYYVFGILFYYNNILYLKPRCSVMN